MRIICGDDILITIESDGMLMPGSELTMTAEEALDFIHSVNWRGAKLGLSRTRELLDRLGNPEDGLKFIHIAGTNGKGSVAAMLSSVLRSAGYKTGLYTSPYISRFNERMQINGVPITDGELAGNTQLIAPHALAMEDRPTEFELVTALALNWFNSEGCDIVVLEVGMGGRLDSTNVIASPECAVITNIGLDHTKELGDTVEKIAAEKADRIKTGCDAVLYQQKESVMTSSLTSAKSAAPRCIPPSSQSLKPSPAALTARPSAMGKKNIPSPSRPSPAEKRRRRSGDGIRFEGPGLEYFRQGRVGGLEKTPYGPPVSRYFPAIPGSLLTEGTIPNARRRRL